MISYSAPSVAILEAPRSQIVSRDRGNVVFRCRVKGEELEWIVNDKINSIERNTRLIELGVQFTQSPRVDGKINATISFPTTSSFNATRMRCVSLNATGTLGSTEAVMIIAGRHYN